MSHSRGGGRFNGGGWGGGGGGMEVEFGLIVCLCISIKFQVNLWMVTVPSAEVGGVVGGCGGGRSTGV